MTHRQKFILTFISCLLITTIIGIYAFSNLASWLFLSDPVPENLDYICTFAGSPDREPYSLQLMKQFTDAKWIVNTERKNFMKWASENGIDSFRITVTPPCSSTLEEIRCFRDIILKQKSKTVQNSPLIGFVSSPYHMRRISVLFALSRNSHFKNGLFLPVPIEKTQFATKDLKKWWKDDYSKRIIMEEMIKMAGNIVISVPVIGPRIEKRVQN